MGGDNILKNSRGDDWRVRSNLLMVLVGKVHDLRK